MLINQKDYSGKKTKEFKSPADEGGHKKPWFRWIRSSGCHLVLALIIPEEITSSTEVQPFQMNFEYLQENCTASLDNLFHFWKNMVNSFFLMLSRNFPFFNWCLLHFPCLCVSENGPALPTKLVLGPCKTISSQGAHAKLPQALLAQSMPQFPAILAVSY